MSSETRGRRNKQTTVEKSPAITQLGAPTLIGAGLLEHGLDTAEEIFVWANKTNPSDINGKLRAGFRLVKFDDVEARLRENGIPASFYTQDEAGNICYGVDLILMVGSRAYQQELIRRALFEQTSLVADASVTELESRLEDALSTTNIRRQDRPRVSKDEDHGTKQALTVKE